MRIQRRILLVDDDLGVRQALGEALELENYAVVSTASGPEALRCLAGPGAGAIDVIVLDLNLGPENGWDVFDHFARIAPRVPVVMITARRGPAPLVRARPCAAFLQKPLDLPLLFQILESLTSPAASAKLALTPAAIPPAKTNSPLVYGKEPAATG